MIWRKIYKSMYEGSMVGSGATVFALMGYIISHQEYMRNVGWVIRLNPRLLATVIGESEDRVAKAIEYLASEDKDSTSKEHGGRRIVAREVGTMEYLVVNGERYQEYRVWEERKEQNRDAQKRYREKMRAMKKAKPLEGETAYEKVLREEGKEAADAWADRTIK